MQKKTKDKPAYTFGRWEVYQDGTLVGGCTTKSGRETKYTIYPDRLNEPDIIIKVVAEKATDLNDFLPAFLQACEMVGINQTIIQTSYL